MGCAFCYSDEGHVCSLCLQKVLSMNQEQLKQVHALAVEKRETTKAEILESYLEETTDEGSNAVERGIVRGRRVRSLRHEKESIRQAQKRKRFPLRQVDEHQPGLSLS